MAAVDAVTACCTTNACVEIGTELIFVDVSVRVMTGTRAGVVSARGVEETEIVKNRASG